MSNLLVVMLGCALGGAMRYLITTYINKLGYFPYGTLAVNLIGCFLIGMIATLLTEKIQGTIKNVSRTICGYWRQILLWQQDLQEKLKKLKSFLRLLKSRKTTVS